MGEAGDGSKALLEVRVERASVSEALREGAHLPGGDESVRARVKA
jgi:hypothetical protein